MTVLEWDYRLSKWLPPSCDVGKEPGYFSNLVKTFGKVVAQAPDDTYVRKNVEWLRTLHPFLSHISKFMRTRMKYDCGHVAQLYGHIMHVVVISKSNPVVHLMWLGTAIKVLRTYRNHLQGHLELDWEVYWSLVDTCLQRGCQSCFDSTSILSVLTSSVELAKAARALFAPAAAAEVWARFEGDLKNGASPVSLEAAAMLLVFFPHRGIGLEPSLPWAEWTAEASRMWGSVLHNAFWDQTWLCFFARLAKHDVHGVIDWHPILRVAMSRATRMFTVPLGNARSVPRSATLPRYPHYHVAATAIRHGTTPPSHLAKLLVYTLRANLVERSRGDGLAPLEALDQLTTLLEHYYHAANTGSWSEDLGTFLDALSWHLCRRRLAAELRPEWPGAASVRLPVALGALEPVAAAILRLATPAVFHKSSTVRVAALEALGNLAYLVPARVLPGVVARLFTAVEASASVHQLATSIRALSYCVRPLLLGGLPLLPEPDGCAIDSVATTPAEASDGLSTHARACAELGRAMVLVLPGLDVNDQNKTEATISFYLAVFSSCNAFRGVNDAEAATAVPLDIDSEDFVLELLRRLAAVIDNLEARGHSGSVDSTTEDNLYCASWLGSYHKLDPMLCELFRKVPAAVLPTAADFVARYALGVTEPQQASDAFSLVSCASSAAPNQMKERLWVPLRDAAWEDIRGLVGVANPSQSSVKRLHARLLLMLAFTRGNAEHAASAVELLLEMALEATRAASAVVITAATSVLNGALSVLIVDGLDIARGREPSSLSACVPGSVNGAAARWAPQTAEDAPRVAWRHPKAQHIAVARHVCERLVVTVRDEIAAMIADGSVADSSHVARLRLRRVQALLATAASVQELAVPVRAAADHIALPTPQESIDIAAPSGAGWEGCTVLDDCTELSLAIAAHTDPSNTAALTCVIRELERFSGTTVVQRNQGHPGLRVKSRDRSYNEPAFADILTGRPPGALGHTARQAYWAAERSVSYNLHLRKQLRATSPWPSSALLELPLVSLRPLTRDAAAALLHLSVSRYSAVAQRAAQATGAMLNLSSELTTAIMSSAVAAAALLHTSALPAHPVAPIKGAGDQRFQLPPNRKAAIALIEEQNEHLVAVIAASKNGTAAAADAASNGTRDGDRNGFCTSENKHIVLGGLAMLDACRGSIGDEAAVNPAAFSALMMAAVVMQGHSLPAVLPSVHRFLAGFGLRLFAPPYASAHSTPPPLSALLTFLLDTMETSRLHWRGAILSHFAFAVLVPSLAGSKLVEAITAMQLRHCVHGDNSLVKEIAACALLQGLHRVLLGSSSADSQRSVVATQVRSAFSDAAWAGALIPALDSLHSTSEGGKASIHVQLKAAPEAMMVLMLCKLPERVWGRDYGLMLCQTPHMPGVAEGGSKAGRAVAWYHAYLLEAFGICAPVELMEAMRAPLVSWDASSPQEEADLPSMEFTAMEAVSGAVASGAAFCVGGTGTSAWHGWLQQLIVSRFLGAGNDLSRLWAFTLARALRSCANEACGKQPHQGLPTSSPAQAAEALEIMAGFVCGLVDRWSGSNTGDLKYTSLLSYSIDLMMQVQSTQPCSPSSTALAKLLGRSHSVLPSALAHPLQAVRHSGANLLVISITAMLSSVPRLSADTLGDSDNRTAESFVAMARGVMLAGREAIVLADSATPPADLAVPGNVTEARIGSAAALAQALAMTPQVQPLVLDALVDTVLPWTISAQCLQSPHLQGLMLQLRALVVYMKNIIPGPEQMPRLLAVLQAGAVQPAWQARASAVALLQVAWFRNYFDMSPGQLLEVVETCRARLADERPEIGTLAGSTLSGLLRVLPACGMSTYLAEVCEEATRLFPPRRRTGNADSKSASLERQACALSLRSLLQSSPYKIRNWMDEVLLAIVRASRFPPPVRTTATQALGDFRKTHENTESRPLRERLTPEVWEGIQDVALQSSYFA